MIQNWDERRDFFASKTHEEAIEFAVQHWIHTSQRAIQSRGRFVVALSGGTTPKEIYQRLTQKSLDWKNIWLFFSDERAVPPDHPDSNYKMAMEAGFSKVAIPPNQIFRMKGELEPEKGAADYCETIHRTLDKHFFDLVMLGVGADGHTASLFPNTKGLHEKKPAVANWVEEKKSWRLTLSFDSINQSRLSTIYALGKNKEWITSKVLEAPIESEYPASRIGTVEHKALWILDFILK